MRRAGMLIGLTCLCAMAVVSLNARNSYGRQAMEAPKPGPEMQKLNFLIGAWDTVSEYEKSTMADGGKQKGWYKAQLGPGGFSVIADFEEDSTVGKDFGHEIISWDPKKKAYTVVTLGNAFPGAVIGTAKWEGDDLVILIDVENAEAVHLRAVYVHPQGNVLHIENYIKIGDAPFQLIYKATAAKK